jgi:hypothetical protein
LTSRFDQTSSHATAGDDDATSFVIRQMTKLKKQYSTEITIDVDTEANRNIQSIEDMERHKLAETLLTQKKELKEEVKVAVMTTPVDDSDTTH